MIVYVCVCGGGGGGGGDGIRHEGACIAFRTFRIQIRTTVLQGKCRKAETFQAGLCIRVRLKLGEGNKHCTDVGTSALQLTLVNHDVHNTFKLKLDQSGLTSS